jgi:hypothetical protein
MITSYLLFHPGHTCTRKVNVAAAMGFRFAAQAMCSAVLSVDNCSLQPIPAEYHNIENIQAVCHTKLECSMWQVVKSP